MIKRITILISAFALLTSACSREESAQPSATAGSEISFTTDEAIASRSTTKNEWELGDMVGITMESDGETFDNYQYTVAIIDEASTTLSYYGDETALLYPNHEQDITLYAYSPYNSTYDDVDGVFSFSANEDFLTSDITTYTAAEYANEAKLSFSFNHRLCYVEIALSPSDEISVEKMSGVIAYLEGHYITMTYDINTGEATGEAKAREEFEMVQGDDENWTAKSLLIPVESQDVYIHFDNGSDYHTSVAFDTSNFEAGKCYNYTAKLGRDAVDIYLNEIEEWNDSIEGGMDSMSSPDGSEASPWLISSAEDLLAIGTGDWSMSDYYYMTEDITLSGEFEPLGDAHYFYGRLSGNGHSISGISSDESDRYLFYEVSSSAVVEGVNIVDCSLTGANYVAGIARINYGLIHNCSVTGTMGNSSSPSSYIGGIAIYNHGAIINCWSDVTITASTAVGGIAAYNYCDVGGCYSLGAITTNSSNAMCGGIVGYNIEGSTSTSSDGYVGACYSAGKISGISSATNIGSITGMDDGGTITERSYYANDTGGIDYSKSCHGKSSAYMRNQSFVEELNSEKFDGNGDYDIYSWTNINLGVDMPSFVN